eukprot:2614937-Amphidinium_carterae.1
MSFEGKGLADNERAPLPNFPLFHKGMLERTPAHQITQKYPIVQNQSSRWELDPNSLTRLLDNGLHFTHVQLFVNLLSMFALLNMHSSRQKHNKDSALGKARVKEEVVQDKLLSSVQEQRQTSES